MFRVYFAVFLVALMSLKAEGQSTIDGGSETCDNSLPTSEQVANLIRHGMEKFIASNQQQLIITPMQTSKLALVSALVCKE